MLAESLLLRATPLGEALVPSQREILEAVMGERVISLIDAIPAVWKH
jgi:hypothetical protein